MHRERRFGRDRRSDGLSGRLLSELEVPRSKERTSSPLANGACNAAGAHHVWPVSGLGLSREISAAMFALGFRWFPSRSLSRLWRHAGLWATALSAPWRSIQEVSFSSSSALRGSFDLLGDSSKPTSMDPGRVAPSWSLF
ncbi:unnamed protein product [Ixodes pacificus]